jgi:hypothetical protein
VTTDEIVTVGDGFGGRGGEIEKAAADVLLEYLRSDGRSKALTGKAKVAGSALSTAARNRATAGARAALDFAVARSLASDPKQLAEYVRITQPTFPTLGSGAKG